MRGRIARRFGTVGALLVLGAAWWAALPALPALADPGISIRVRAVPDSGTPGTRITFRYEVTNTGDEPLVDVAVTDDAVGDVGGVDELRPGRTVRFAAQIVLRGAPIRNVAVATAATAEGAEVRATDVATVTVVAGGAAAGSGGDSGGSTGGAGGTSPGGGLAFTGLPAAAAGAAAALLALAGSALLAASTRRADAGTPPHGADEARTAR
ncbi:MAG TPA: hypothetical protein VNP94_05950 [Actinomycetota bacterium]|nr:hypothetical protein [Actinomycetota bacterium]